MEGELVQGMEGVEGIVLRGSEQMGRVEEIAKVDRQAGQPEFKRLISDFFNTTSWVSCLSLLGQVCMPPVGEEVGEEDSVAVGEVGEVPLRVRSGCNPNRLEGSLRSKPRREMGEMPFPPTQE